MGKVTGGGRTNWVRGSRIGRGSFGTVSLAVDQSDGHVFAVKSVDRMSCLTTQLEALESEIRILRSLSSPYVVEYLGDDETCESGTTSYRNLHVEYLPAGTVADSAKHSGLNLNEDILRSYAWCIVSALSYVHSEGIVHCDVKGKNVLVGPTAGVAKLADFGSAVEFPVSTLPRGSPLWMAPEVVRGEYQGPESDVWSLGCTVIEMVTGRPAWEDRGADTLCRIGHSDELPEFPTQLSELGRDFVSKCLQRERSERWSCDRLLRHPFISSSSPSEKMTNPSPRCVLDWLNSEFCSEEEEEDDDDDGKETPQNMNSWNNRSHGAVPARERIGKLATKTGAIWESDGWVVVREREDVSVAARRSGDEEEGISREYSNWSDGERESGRANMENWESGMGAQVVRLGWAGMEAGWSRRYGSGERRSVKLVSLFLLYITTFAFHPLCTLFSFYLGFGYDPHVNNHSIFFSHSIFFF